MAVIHKLRFQWSPGFIYFSLIGLCALCFLPECIKFSSEVCLGNA